MKRSIFIFIALTASSSAFAGWGFDWTNPKQARCIESSMKPETQGCVQRESGDSFTGDSGPFLACKRESGEVLQFCSKEVCQAQLEAMLANGDEE